MRNRAIVTVICLSLTLAAGLGFVSANAPATLVLRSGERVSGELADMGGVDFTMVVNGQERHIPIGDVAVIDFVGAGQDLPPVEISQLQIGGHTIFMRGGQVVQGRLADIGGDRPLSLTVKIGSDEHKYHSNDVARIYLAQPPSGAVATTGTVPPADPTQGRQIIVPADRNWTPTGIFVTGGEFVNFSTTGEIRFSRNEDDVAGPAGARKAVYPMGGPLPNVLTGALLGRVGNSQPFGIGDQISVPMPASGELFLGINDDLLSDNSGQFNVTVRTSTPR